MDLEHYMNDILTKVFSAPFNAPEYPDIGDLWYNPDDQLFYTFDGIVWVPYSIDVDIAQEDTPENTDTPEQAYDRAMGVLK